MQEKQPLAREQEQVSSQLSQNEFSNSAFNTLSFERLMTTIESFSNPLTGDAA
jgi:hypothetical protein